MSVETRYANSNWNDLIGLSTTLDSATRRASIAARSDLLVLFLGAPGVGKETFARLIARESQTFCVKLSAGRLTSRDWSDLLNQLTESKVETSFRNLVGGVLYLTDVEHVPLEFQRRFARAFQTSTPTFRVLFGTSQSFLNLREKRAFDAEFEALLVGFPIALPDLSERKPDFAELSNAFFREESARLGAPARELTPDELQRLAAREYPENLDDLRKTLASLAASGELPSEMPNAQVDAATDAPFLTIDEAAKRHIEEALRRSKGVVEGKTGAANALDINPYTLRARMRKLKIDWTKFRSKEEA